MPLRDLYATGKRAISFELFPPKTAQGETALYRHVEQLIEFRPSFITCTYGAGGSTRDKTMEVVEQVKQRFDVPVASHLTCVGSTVGQLRQYLQRARDAGVDYIVALRGDPPRGEQSFQAVQGGLRYANELVDLIQAEFSEFGVAVAGYPEKHQEAPSLEVDLQNLKRKVDAGADVVLTQLFYNNGDFFRFRDLCQQHEITVPLVPGILPVTNLGQIQRITSLCAAQLPHDFVSDLKRQEDADWQFRVGTEFAAAQIRELLDAGVPGVHFYVLNKSKATAAVLKAVGL